MSIHRGVAFDFPATTNKWANVNQQLIKHAFFNANLNLFLTLVNKIGYELLRVNQMKEQDKVLTGRTTQDPIYISAVQTIYAFFRI